MSIIKRITLVILSIAILFGAGWGAYKVISHFFSTKSSGGASIATPDPVELKKYLQMKEWVQNTKDWKLKDADMDGLTDETEKKLGTNPNKEDSDGDGLLDGEEANNFHTNPLKSDTDGDGITDFKEVENGTNPLGAGKIDWYKINPSSRVVSSTVSAASTTTE